MNPSTTCRCLTAIAICLFFPALLAAWQETGDASLVQRIQALSRKAKEVDSGSGYSDIIIECDDLLEEELEKESHRTYLKTLLAWALDMRAGTRIELARQFREVDSFQQADQIHEKAMQDFQRSLENDPRRWQTMMHRAEVLVSLKEYESAIEDYTRVISVKPETPSARFNRAELKASQKQFQEAIEDYTQVLARHPDDVQAESGRADCYWHLKQFDLALQGYDRVVEQLPDDGWALANRADAHLAMNHWQQARDDLAKAVSLGSNGEFCRRLSWLLATCPDESICDGDEALSLARRAIEITGESAENLDALAAALAAAGQFDRARDVYARVIALNDSQDPAAEVKQAAYEKNERYQESFDR